MSVLARLLVQKRVDIHAFLLPGIGGLCAWRMLRKSQKHLRRQVDKTAFFLVFMAPENRLILWGILRERVQDRPDGRVLCVRKHRDRRLHCCIRKPRQYVVEIAGPFHKYELRIFFGQEILKMPGPGRGEMPDAENMWMIHYSSQSAVSVSGSGLSIWICKKSAGHGSRIRPRKAVQSRLFLKSALFRVKNSFCISMTGSLRPEPSPANICGSFPYLSRFSRFSRQVAAGLIQPAPF